MDGLHSFNCHKFSLFFSQKMDVKRWIPLESNPEIFTEFASKLGVSNIDQYSFCDVYGLDGDLLAMVPPCPLAVLLLFPISDATEQIRKEQAQRFVGCSLSPTWPYFMKQTIGNACGTIGLLHALCNNLESLHLESGSFLQRFVEATKDLSPDARGKYLEQPPTKEGSIDSIHAEAGKQGQTTPPSAEESVDLHFVTFILKDDLLWELDGRKAGPICHTNICTNDGLLHAAASVIKHHFLDCSNGSLNFSVMALVSAG